MIIVMSGHYLHLKLRLIYFLPVQSIELALDRAYFYVMKVPVQ